MVIHTYIQLFVNIVHYSEKYIFYAIVTIYFVYLASNIVKLVLLHLDALQAGASQFEASAGKLKRKFWWKNCKVGTSVVSEYLNYCLIKK